MQGGHAQVACLGEGDGVVHRLAVADLAHQAVSYTHLTLPTSDLV